MMEQLETTTSVEVPRDIWNDVRALALRRGVKVKIVHEEVLRKGLKVLEEEEEKL